MSRRTDAILAPLGFSIATATLTYPVETALETQALTQFQGATLKFAGTGLRLPNPVVTVSGNNYRARDVPIGMPDYELSEFYFFIATFACPTPGAGGETDCTSVITVETVEVRAVDGSRVTCQIDDGSDPVVIDPAVSATQYGRWIKVTTPTPIPASSTPIFSFVGHVSDGTMPGVVGGGAEVESIFGGTVPDARSQGSSSSLVGVYTGNTPYGNQNGPGFAPSAMLVETPPHILSGVAFGDSVGFGDGQTDNKSWRTSRNAFGFLEMGMDDDTDSDRINLLNWCLPGWGFLENSGTEPNRTPVTTGTHGNALAMPGQIWALQKAVELNGGRPVADFGIMQHLTNSATSILANQEEGYRNACAILRSSVGGDASFPVFGVMPPQYVVSSNGFADVAGQSPQNVHHDYPDGRRWLMIDKIGGDGVENDPTAEFQVDGTLQGSINLWAVSAADLTTQRDLVSTFAFSATLTSAYNGSGPVMMDTKPDDGVSLVFDDGSSNGNVGGVVSVTGTGPYAVEMAWFKNGVALSSGSSVTRSWFDGGQHPGGPISHKQYADEAVIPFKVAQGWVPANSAPVMSNATISGTPQDGETLTASATATGFPEPTFTYQWRRNGVDISGETASTIVLDAAADGWVDGDIVSINIRATNSEGFDEDQPQVTFEVPVPAAAPVLVDSVQGSGSAGAVSSGSSLTATGSDRHVFAMVGAGTSDAISDISCSITGASGTASMTRVFFSGTNTEDPAAALEAFAGFTIDEAGLAAIGAGPYDLDATATGSNVPDKLGLVAGSIENAPNAPVIVTDRATSVTATPASDNSFVFAGLGSSTGSTGATMTGATQLENLNYGDGLQLGWAEQDKVELTVTNSVVARSVSALVIFAPDTL